MILYNFLYNYYSFMSFSRKKYVLELLKNIGSWKATGP